MATNQSNTGNQSRENVQSEKNPQQGQTQQAQGQQRSMQKGQRGMSRQGQFTSPFGMLSRMMEDMDRMFFGGLSNFGGFAQEQFPKLDVFERGNQLVVRADLPGVESKDVKLDFDDGVLTISGERNEQHEEKLEQGGYRFERSYGSFARSVPLGEGINPDTAHASMKNGVLEISFDKPDQQPRGKRIEIADKTKH